MTYQGSHLPEGYNNPISRINIKNKLRKVGGSYIFAHPLGYLEAGRGSRCPRILISVEVTEQYNSYCAKHVYHSGGTASIGVGRLRWADRTACLNARPVGAPPGCRSPGSVPLDPATAYLRSFFAVRLSWLYLLQFSFFAESIIRPAGKEEEKTKAPVSQELTEHRVRVAHPCAQRLVQLGDMWSVPTYHPDLGE